MSYEDKIKKLNDMSFNVTQKEATEPPFRNEYWDHFEDGIYVDIVSGEPLFSSRDKYDAGCGWPSFTQTIKDNILIESTDYKLMYPRTEIKSQQAKSHLGHVFNDGPKENGLRYCINSAALRFIPVDQMESEGYGDFLVLFK